MDTNLVEYALLMGLLIAVAVVAVILLGQIDVAHLIEWRNEVAR